MCSVLERAMPPVLLKHLLKNTQILKPASHSALDHALPETWQKKKILGQKIFLFSYKQNGITHALAVSLIDSGKKTHVCILKGFLFFLSWFSF